LALTAVVVAVDFMAAEVAPVVVAATPVVVAATPAAVAADVAADVAAEVAAESALLEIQCFFPLATSNKPIEDLQC
jgi:hypothetical protein